jgi:hypothetical protein
MLLRFHSAWATVIGLMLRNSRSMALGALPSFLLVLWTLQQVSARPSTKQTKSEVAYTPYFLFEPYTTFGQSLIERHLERHSEDLSAALRRYDLLSDGLHAQEKGAAFSQLREVLDRRREQLRYKWLINAEALAKVLTPLVATLVIADSTCEEGDLQGSAPTAAPGTAQTPGKLEVDLDLLTSSMQYDSWQQVLAHLARDWSTSARPVRENVHRPILQALARIRQTSAAKQIRVLVPGAGLGRLAFEIAKRGFVVEANECSYLMLAASYSIFNRDWHCTDGNRSNGNGANSNGANSNGADGNHSNSFSVPLYPYLELSRNVINAEGRFISVQVMLTHSLTHSLSLARFSSLSLALFSLSLPLSLSLSPSLSLTLSLTHTLSPSLSALLSLSCIALCVLSL